MGMAVCDIVDISSRSLLNITHKSALLLFGF